MHTVMCPNCDKVLRIPKAVSNARIRCTGCQAVFVASSTPIDLPEVTPVRQSIPVVTARAKSGGSGKARLYRGKPKAPVSPVIVAAVGAGVLGVIALAIAFAYMASKKTNNETPDKDVSKTQPPKPAPGAGGGGERGGVTARRDGDQGGGPDTRPAPRAGNGGRTAGTGGSPPEHDALIKISHHHRTDDYGNVTFYGQVRNMHKYPVSQVALVFTVPDATGKDVQAQAVCHHVPSTGTAGFSIKLGQLPEGVSPTIVAKSVPEPKDVVCWRVDTSSVQMDAESVRGAITINGRVANDTDTTVTDVKLYCDFFWKAGPYHSTVVGKLTKAFEIRPGKSEAYRVTLEKILAPAGINDQTTMRLVGRVVQ